MKIKKTFLLATTLITSSLFLNIMPTQNASAVSGSDFRADRIMDDAVFFSSGDLTPTQIQSFLNSKVPVCDTNHARTGSDNDSGPPYTCLKDYRQNTNSKPAESGLCGAMSAKSNQPAAQIIYDVSKACGVSTRVLLVLLQKEQSLVTDTWPWDIQYRSATGFGCPDTAPCDSDYYGFFNQVYHAARVYKVYAKINGPNYRVGYTNYIQWHPNAGCGGSDVLIQTQATAGLYNYTPYRPNQAALNNLYGTGDDCSSYGNRNFWRMYSDWFGSTFTEKSYAWSLVDQKSYSNTARTANFKPKITVQPGEVFYLRIVAQNYGNKTWDDSFLRLATKTSGGSKFIDDSWIGPTRVTAIKENSVSPGNSGTFEFVMKAPQKTGTYKEYFSLVAEARAWLNDIGLYYQIDVVNPSTPANTKYSLSSGEQLNRGEKLMSTDKRSVFVLKNDGNAVQYTNFKKMWASNTRKLGGSKLHLQTDGNLVLRNSNNSAVWNSGTAGNPGSTLTLQTDGNLVLKNNSGVAIWSTGNTNNPGNLIGVDYSLRDGVIYPGQELNLANLRYKLKLQHDGNIVLRNSSGKAIWQSQTYGKAAAYLQMQYDGNLVLRSTNNKAIWYTGTSNSNRAYITLQHDGNLIIRDTQRKAIWYTGTVNL